MIRSIWVLLAAGIATFFYASRVLVSVLLKRDDVFRLGHEIPTRWSRTVLWIAGVKVEAEGLRHLPDNRARVIVANHESWFDIFALSAVLPVQFRFVGKKELVKIPILGPAWVGSGHLAIDRGDRNSAISTLQEGAKKMKAQELSIIVFPEGTRSEDGEIQRFKKGAFVLALEAQCPIVPVGIEGSGTIMPKGGFRIRSGTIRVRIGEPMMTAGNTSEERGRLLEEVQVAVTELKRGPGGPPEMSAGRGGTH